MGECLEAGYRGRSLRWEIDEMRMERGAGEDQATGDEEKVCAKSRPGRTGILSCVAKL
jgi:hypothetical protein